MNTSGAESHQQFERGAINNPSSTASRLPRNYKIYDFTKDELGYGFRITGNAPVKVYAVRTHGAAYNAGMRENDEILEINQTHVRDKTHKDVVSLIRASNRVIMKVSKNASDTISQSNNSNVGKSQNNNAHENNTQNNHSKSRVSNVNNKSHGNHSPLNKKVSPKKVNSPSSSGSTISTYSNSRTTRIPTNITTASSSSSQIGSHKGNSLIRSPPNTHNAVNNRIKSNTSTMMPSTNHNSTSGPPQPSPKLLSELQMHQNKSNRKSVVPQPSSHIPDSTRSSTNTSKPVTHSTNGSGNATVMSQQSSSKDTSSPPVFKKPYTVPAQRPKSVYDPTINKKSIVKSEVALTKEVVKSNSNLSSNSTSSTTDISTSSENTETIPSNRILTKKNEFDDDHDIETPIKSYSYNASTISKNNGSRIKSSYGSIDNLAKSSANNSRQDLRLDGIGGFGDNTRSKGVDGVKKVRFLSKWLKTNRFQGRSFDEEEEEDDDLNNGKVSAIHEILKDFNKTTGRPGIVAQLFEIAIKETPEMVNYMFLFFSIKNYEMQQERSNFSDSARRMANEILTTFLLDDSPIKILFQDEKLLNVMTEIRQNWKNSENLGSIFVSLKLTVQESMQEFIQNIQMKIERGTLYHNWTITDNNESEMKKLFRVFDNFNPKNSKQDTKSDFIRAQQIAYCTMYSTFLRSQPFTPTSSFRWKSRSTDNLNQTTKIPSIAETYKLTSLSSFSEAKNFSSMRKKTKSINGHNLKLESCEEPHYCAVCNNLLWGPSPQGYKCTSCLTSVHIDCRKKFKISCSKKSKKYSSQTSLKEDKTANNNAGFFGRLSRKNSSTSVKSSTCLNEDAERTTVGSLKEQNYQFSSGNNDERHINSTINQNSRYFDYPGEEQLNRASSMYLPTKSSDIYLNSNNYPVSTPRYDSKFEQFKLSNSTNGSSAVGVQIKELVPSVDDYQDPDMNVDESFDAAIELTTYFPNLPDTADKKRIIVLLEFYHKTRYILMNLKKLHYKLVLNWPEKYMNYFQQLGLGAVEPLIKLIKSLVNLIDTCVGENDFIDMETKIYNWITNHNDSNLKEWIGLVSNLVCTNNLNSSKTIKQQIRNGGLEFEHIITAKYNKSYVLDNLNQMRPLLINLPLITKNITKCLKKSQDKYNDQLQMWVNISVKLDCLCEFIDRCCVPLVEYINAGIIKSRPVDFQKQFMPFARTPLSASSFMSSTSIDGSLDIPTDLNDEFREYCQEFPRLMFSHPICDYEHAKIFEWRTNMKKGVTGSNYGLGNSTPGSSGHLQSSVSFSGSSNTQNQELAVQMKYFKRGTDVMLLLYHRFIVVLQKDQEHYLLKLIKPQRGSSEDYRFPILNIDSKDLIVTIGGVEDEFHILNIIENKQEYALLLRIGFRSLEVAENWLELIKHKRHNIERTISIFKTADPKQTPPIPTSLHRSDTNASNNSNNSALVTTPPSATIEPSNLDKLPPVLAMEKATADDNETAEKPDDKEDEKVKMERNKCTEYCLKKLENFSVGNDDFLKEITDENLTRKMDNVFSYDKEFDMSPCQLQESRTVDFKFALYKYCLNVVQKTRECFLDESLDLNSEFCCLVKKQFSMFKPADEENIKCEIQSKENTPIEKGSQDSVEMLISDLITEIIDSSVDKIELTDQNKTNSHPIKIEQNHIQSKVPPATLPKPNVPASTISNHVTYLNCIPTSSIEPNDSMLNNNNTDSNSLNDKSFTSRKDIVVTYREPEASKIAAPVTSFYKPPPQPSLASSYLHKNNPPNHNSANKQMTTIDEIIPAEPRDSIILHKSTKSSTSSC